MAGSPGWGLSGTRSSVCRFGIVFSPSVRKSPAEGRGWLGCFRGRLALFRRGGRTRFLTSERSRANWHCASWRWTLGLLVGEALHRFCGQQSDRVSPPLNEGLTLLPGFVRVEGWAVLALVALDDVNGDVGFSDCMRD